MDRTRFDARAVMDVLIAAALMVSPLSSHPAFAAGEARDRDHGQIDSARMRLSEIRAALPDVVLVRSDGKRVSLPKELDDGRPVVLNFIFTTCPGICPIMSHTFSLLQDKLGPDRERVHMVSISIDPEQDTPARLRAYAKQFSAGPQWQHYTGSVEASIAAQKALGAYAGDKMSHDPVTFMRAAPGQQWRRIDGFASAEDLMTVFSDLTAHVVAATAN
jgi:protein SCO1/2